MNDQQKQHEPGDEQLSALYRHSRIDEPPMALDSAILQRARQAVEAKPGWWPWLRRFWFAPLATAAVALLTVSVVIQMRQQHPETLAPAPGLQLEAPVEQKAEPVPDNLLKKEKRALEQSAPAPVAPAIDRESRAPARRQASAPPAAAGKPQPATMMMENEAEKRLRATDVQSGSAAPKAAADATAPQPAEAWIQRIRELLKAGKRDEAKAELAAFAKAWPNYPLPPELRSLQMEK